MVERDLVLAQQYRNILEIGKDTKGGENVKTNVFQINCDDLARRALALRGACRELPAVVRYIFKVEGLSMECFLRR